MWPQFPPDMNKTIFLLPLAVTISLVYSATRYELPKAILNRATKLCLMIIAGMGVVILLLTWLSAGL